MVEHLFCTQMVEGSSPFRGSKCRYGVGGSSPPSTTNLDNMEEIEKAKITRTKKTNGSEVHQVMTALTDTTIRGIVRSANEEGIKREDIVSLLKENGQFVLIYFR